MKKGQMEVYPLIDEHEFISLFIKSFLLENLIKIEKFHLGKFSSFVEKH
jgi:hypothetical protein